MARAQSGRDLVNAPKQVILGTAADIVKKQSRYSTLFNPTVESQIPRFEKNEIFTGKVIGRGGFCSVHEISAIRLQDQRRPSFGFGQGKDKKKKKRTGGSSDAGSTTVDETIDGSDMTPREYMSATCSKGGTPRYVIKRVAEELEHQSRVSYLKGAVDLAMETKFLATLQHPNIMEIRGIAAGGPFRDNYYIVLDRLTETLPKRIRRWTTTDRQCKGITGAFVGGKKKINSLFVDRLYVAYNIANALNYMHKLQIIYRDLKPDNIGFDLKGNVKIFDFGLAKQLRPDERLDNGLYRMTGFTGSIRYMAPEVGLKRPYNLKADIYSFSMLLWFVMALEPPYGMYTPQMFMQRVFQIGHRPVTLDTWPPRVCSLMKASWDMRLHVRPNCESIMYVLKQEVAMVDTETSARMNPILPRFM